MVQGTIVRERTQLTGMQVTRALQLRHHRRCNGSCWNRTANKRAALVCLPVIIIVCALPRAADPQGLHVRTKGCSRTGAMSRVRDTLRRSPCL